MRVLYSLCVFYYHVKVAVGLIPKGKKRTPPTHSVEDGDG